jgi:hypothetical protein
MIPTATSDRTNRRRTTRRWAAMLLGLAICWLAPARASGRSFIWKATRNGNVVYLVGSVHVLSQNYYPLDAAFEDAYRDSNLLVEEVDLGTMMSMDSQLALLSRGMLPAGQTLDTVLSPPTMALVNKAAGDLGPAIEPLKRFKPWMLAIALEGVEMQKAGFDPELGLDKHFYDAAQSQGKQVQGLESVEFQISRFDGMTAEQQDHFLAETLKELDTEKASVSRLADAWKTGDVATLEKITLKDLESDQMMYQRLLVERNRNWMPKIEALFARQGHAFVVVGAAHLVGPDGILQMLRSKGYAVDQL